MLLKPRICRKGCPRRLWEFLDGERLGHVVNGIGAHHALLEADLLYREFVSVI